MEREVGGGIGMGNTCKPMAVSFQCMKKKKKEQTSLNLKSILSSESDRSFTGPTSTTSQHFLKDNAMTRKKLKLVIFCLSHTRPGLSCFFLISSPIFSKSIWYS